MPELGVDTRIIAAHLTGALVRKKEDVVNAEQAAKLYFEVFHALKAEDERGPKPQAAAFGTYGSIRK
jgi:hypothetical protein